MNLVSSSIRLASAGLAAAALAAPAAAAVGRAIDFLPAVQTLTQGARVIVSNLPNQQQGLPPDPCKVSVGFYDPAGTLVGGKLVTFTIVPGASVQVTSTFFSATGAAVPVRARVTFAAAPKSGLDTCGGVNANHEVFDNATLQTHVMNPGVIRGFNPQPDPPVANGATDE